MRRGARCGGGGGGRRVVGDDAVDADEDGVDERHERVEAARDEGAAAQRLDVADAVEDVEQHRVVEPLELVRGLGPAAACAPHHHHLLLLLQLLLLLPRRRLQLHPTQAAGRHTDRDRGEAPARGGAGREPVGLAAGRPFLVDLIGFPCGGSLAALVVGVPSRHARHKLAHVTAGLRLLRCESESERGSRGTGIGGRLG